MSGSDDPDTRSSRKDKKSKKDKGLKQKTSRAIVSASAAMPSAKGERGQK